MHTLPRAKHVPCRKIVLFDEMPFLVANSRQRTKTKGVVTKENKQKKK